MTRQSAVGLSGPNQERLFCLSANSPVSTHNRLKSLHCVTSSEHLLNAFGPVQKNPQPEGMTKEIMDPVIPDESILSKIYFLRGKKVMLDRDLAFLYGVETKSLKRQVRRNELRFPEDFMFELNDKEFEDWRRQFGTSNEDRMGLRYKPFAFTEEGVAQLSTVLNSERAIKVNIQIIRMFTKMRSFMLSNKDILRKLDEIERRYNDHDKKIEAIFNYLKKLKSADQTLSDFKNRNRIGFKPGSE